MKTVKQIEQELKQIESDYIPIFESFIDNNLQFYIRNDISMYNYLFEVFNRNREQRIAWLGVGIKLGVCRDVRAIIWKHLELDQNNGNDVMFLINRFLSYYPSMRETQPFYWNIRMNKALENEAIEAEYRERDCLLN